MSGAELYGRFCAACHGTTGVGNGPVAASFAFEVPDLTRIARRGGGQFNRDRVERIIDGRTQIGSHGSRKMPVWGEDFALTEVGNPDAEKVTRTIIGRLVDYIESNPLVVLASVALEFV
jgi:mono/diheme cytochrome c family protein